MNEVPAFSAELEERDLQAQTPCLQIGERRIRASVNLQGRDEFALGGDVGKGSPCDTSRYFGRAIVVLQLMQVACGGIDGNDLRGHRRSEAVHRSACAFQALERP